MRGAGAGAGGRECFCGVTGMAGCCTCTLALCRAPPAHPRSAAALHRLLHPPHYTTPHPSHPPPQGLVEAVGVSNYGPRQLQRISAYLEKRGVPLAAVQVQYSLLR